MSSLSRLRGLSGKGKPPPVPESALAVGHLYLDTRRRLLYFLNESARRLQAEGIPFTAADLQRQPLQNLAGQPITAAELPLERAWRDGRSVETTFLLTRRGGAVQHVHWTAAPLWDSKGQVIALVASVHVRPPEPDWQALAGLTHDLRSPLHALRLLVSLALDEQTPAAERRELLERIRTAAEHALSVGGDLLEWCRGPVQGGRRVEMNWLPLEPFLAGLAQEVAVAAHHKGLRLVPLLESVAGWEMLTDRVRLSRLLANLLNNAVRYTPTGRIELRAAWRDGPHFAGGRHLVLSVADTGTGISPEEQESIFQPFERGSAGRSDSFSGGSGLGLAVVDRLVEELQLGLEVTSECGRGSSFDLVVPGAILRRGGV